jgi:hypothetical protein
LASSAVTAALPVWAQEVVRACPNPREAERIQTALLLALAEGRKWERRRNVQHVQEQEARETSRAQDVSTWHSRRHRTKRLYAASLLGKLRVSMDRASRHGCDGEGWKYSGHPCQECLNEDRAGKTSGG